MWEKMMELTGAVRTEEEDVLKASGRFSGAEGATSLKAEIVARIPRIFDASSFREARRLLTTLGGPVALVEELTFAGFVDPTTEKLTVNEKPFNVFAQMVAGRVPQPAIEHEQIALGKYKERFMICANRPDNDLHWDSTDPHWIPRASMAKRHRFLTTRDLHWQWFNMLVVGLVPKEFGGVDIHAAIAEVEDMKAAALGFAKKVGGWSDNVGLYVNIFGHNNVNSMFIHILDMSAVGPGFGFQSFKNCPLDDILKVLKEEATTASSRQAMSPAISEKAMRRRRDSLPFFFRGTDGATSVKAELVGRIPVMKDAASYREARRLLTEELGGTIILKQELLRSGWVDEHTHQLSTGTQPFNVFARCVSGAMKQPGMDIEQGFLGPYQEQYFICSNRPENDAHWDSDDPEWVGKASMSKRHRFLTIKDLHWQWFNALVFGIVDAEEGGVSIEQALEKVVEMKAAALHYAEKAGWGGPNGENAGLYFHVFGHNSVNSLHLHILDKRELGPTFWKYEYKNMPIDGVIKVLKEAQDKAEEARVHAASLDDGVSTTTDRQAFSTKGITTATRPRTASYMKLAGEVLSVNVGGESLSVPRETMLLAPEGSKLHELFQNDWHTVILRDEQGRMFLNYPPRPFKVIVDYMRRIHNTPEDEIVPPATASRDVWSEVKVVAGLLGISDFLSQSHWGRAEAVTKHSGKRSSVFCCARRRPLSPPIQRFVATDV